MRTNLTILCVCVSVLCGASDVRGDTAYATRYTLTDLGGLGGTDSWPMAINSSGQVAGTALTPDGIRHAFFWQPGSTMQDLGTLGGADYSSATGDINDTGQVVGESRHVSKPTDVHAFLWDSRSGMQDLNPLLGQQNPGASGINNSGQIVGGGSLGAFLWQSGSGVQLLGTLGGSASGANAINESGQVVGQSTDSAHHNRAFLWQRDTGMQSLGTLGGVTISSAFDINDHGQVVGTATASDESYHAFLWQSDTGMRDLGTLGSNYTQAYGINNLGQVVGFSSIGEFYSHAFLWQSSTGMLDLNDLLVSRPADLTLMTAFAINDSGCIAAEALDKAGHAHAVLLAPVPEPCTLTLIATALAGAAVLRGVIRCRARERARNRLPIPMATAAPSRTSCGSTSARPSPTTSWAPMRGGKFLVTKRCSVPPKRGRPIGRRGRRLVFECAEQRTMLTALIWDPGHHGAGNRGGDGQWDTDPLHDYWWNGTSYVAWSNSASNEAVFQDTAGTVSVSGQVAALKLTFQTDAYEIAAVQQGDAISLSTWTTEIATPLGVSANFTVPLTGGGNLRKTGQGTAVVSAGSNLIGNININGGGFQVAGAVSCQNLNVGDSAMLLGAGSVNIGGGAELYYTSAADSTFAGIVGGDGAVHLDSTTGHALALTNSANTYSGGTVLTSGALVVSDDGSLGDSSTNVTFDGDATLRWGGDFDLPSTRSIVVDQGYAGTFDAQSYHGVVQGVVSGGGAVRIVGASTGNIELGNTSNSYTGGTFLHSGILKVSNDLVLGAVPSTHATNIIFEGNATLRWGETCALDANRDVLVNANCTATFDTPGDRTGTVHGLISGAGALAKTGGGVLLLDGHRVITVNGQPKDAGNYYLGNTTILEGTLRAGNLWALGGRTEGSGVGDNLIINGGYLDLNGQKGESVPPTDREPEMGVMVNALSGTGGAVIDSVGGGVLDVDLRDGEGEVRDYVFCGDFLQQPGGHLPSLWVEVGGYFYQDEFTTINQPNSLSLRGGELHFKDFHESTDTLAMGTVTVEQESGQPAPNMTAETFEMDWFGLYTVAPVFDWESPGTLTVSGDGQGHGVAINPGVVQIGDGAVLVTGDGLSLADGTLNVTGGLLRVSGGGVTVGREGCTPSVVVSGGRFEVASTCAVVLGPDVDDPSEQSLSSVTVSGAGVLSIEGTGDIDVNVCSIHLDGNTLVSGTLETGRTFQYRGNANFEEHTTLEFDNGTLRAMADNSAMLDWSGNTHAHVLIDGGAKIDTNGHDVTIDQGLEAAFVWSGGLTKLGTGELTLAGASSYSGETHIEDGTLTLHGATGALPSGSALVFDGTATFNYDNAGASTNINQTLGTLTFSTGEGTVVVTRTADHDSALTFASLMGRGWNGTGNFAAVNALGQAVSPITSRIAFTNAPDPQGQFLDRGLFYGGSQYAVYDTSGATEYLRPMSYAGDPYCASVPAGQEVGSNNANKHVEITGTISAQPTITLNTLKTAGGYNFTLLADRTLTLANSGLLKTQGGNGTISGGVNSQITRSGSGDVVVRADGPSDNLNIDLPIQNAATLVKSGLGTVDITGLTAFCDEFVVNAGTLKADAGSLPNIVRVRNTATLLIDQASNGTYPDYIEGAGSIVKTGSGTLTLTGTDAHTGGTTISQGIVVADTDSLCGDVANNTELVFHQETDGVFDGDISGSGSVTKTGDGSLTVTGTNTYQGGTEVNDGTLQVGSMAALPAGRALTIGAGGTVVLASGLGDGSSGNQLMSRVTTSTPEETDKAPAAPAMTYRVAPTAGKGYTIKGSGTSKDPHVVEVADPGEGNKGLISFDLVVSIASPTWDQLDAAGLTASQAVGLQGIRASIFNMPSAKSPLLGSFTEDGTPAPFSGQPGAVTIAPELLTIFGYGGKVQGIDGDGGVDIGGSTTVAASGTTYITGIAHPLAEWFGGVANAQTGMVDFVVGTFQYSFSGGKLTEGLQTQIDARGVEYGGLAGMVHAFTVDGGQTHVRLTGAELTPSPAPVTIVVSGGALREAAAALADAALATAPAAATLSDADGTPDSGSAALDATAPDAASWAAWFDAHCREAGAGPIVSGEASERDAAILAFLASNGGGNDGSRG